MVASRPAPQTQTRGRRRVRLGLLGALIPPAAGAPVSTCRGLWLLTAVSQPSHNPVAPLIYRLDAVLSAGSIGGTEPGVRPVIGTSSSGVRAASTERHSQQLQPAGTAQPPVPPRWCASIQRIVSSLASPPPPSPRCERGEGVFLESHPRPPECAVSWVGRREPQGTMAASLMEPFGSLRVLSELIVLD